LTQIGNHDLSVPQVSGTFPPLFQASEGLINTFSHFDRAFENKSSEKAEIMMVPNV